MSRRKAFTLYWLYIWRAPMLRLLLLVMLVILTAIPVYLYRVVYPQFRQFVENEARSTAVNMAKNLVFPVPLDGLFLEGVDGPGALSVLSRRILASTVGKGLVYTIRAYDRNGVCVFATDPGRVGLQEKSGEFRKLVMAGEPFSRITRASGSRDGYPEDVAETFIPAMQGGVFLGALELHQPLTYQTQTLEELVRYGLWLILALLALIAVTWWFMLRRFSLAERTRLRLEKQIRHRNNRLAARVDEQTQEILVGQELTVNALADLAEFNDEDTGQHLSRMSAYSMALAAELGKNSPYADRIDELGLTGRTFGMAAVLHDIGKVATPERVLRKPGRLNEEEFAIMKQHTTVGAAVLGAASDDFVDRVGKKSYLALAADVARAHHEKWNGTGYPAGLKGEAIPLAARIVSLADVYDALRSPRPYKKGWTHEAAVEEIRKGSGTHFDPVIVQAFLAIADNFDAIWRISSGENAACPLPGFGDPAL